MLVIKKILYVLKKKNVIKMIFKENKFVSIYKR
jgi:hypothetical protein